MRVCLQVYMFTRYMPGTYGVQEGIKSPRTRVTKGWELLYECWEVNPSPPKQQCS